MKTYTYPEPQTIEAGLQHQAWLGIADAFAVRHDAIVVIPGRSFPTLEVGLTTATFSFATLVRDENGYIVVRELEDRIELTTEGVTLSRSLKADGMREAIDALREAVKACRA